MEKKNAALIVLLLMAFGMYGCATSKVNKLETDIINRTERLSYDIRNLNEKVDSINNVEAQPSEEEAARIEAVEGQQTEVQNDLEQLKDKLATTEAELSHTKRELAEMKEALDANESPRRASNTKPRPQPRQAVMQTAKPAAQTVAKPQKTAASPKIKVLGGDGRIASGRAAARRLEAMGYKVERVDRENSRYSRPVVYYTANFEGTAREIAGRMGGGTFTKPLTWNSIFDIIVMTEK